MFRLYSSLMLDTAAKDMPMHPSPYVVCCQFCAPFAAVQCARLKGLQQRRQHSTPLVPRRIRNYNNKDDGIKVVGLAAREFEALV
jgi:hypothetical protein